MQFFGGSHEALRVDLMARVGFVHLRRLGTPY